MPTSQTHSESLEAVMDIEVELSTTGLTTFEASARLRKVGRNEIPERRTPLWMLFGRQFVGAMPLTIAAAGVLSAALEDWVDFAVIGVLLLTNALLGFWEEVKARASIDALKSGLVRLLPVKRDGVFAPLDVAELVPGDVLFLRGGNIVPADCVWLEGDELSVDQAALTGESLPIAVPREEEEQTKSGDDAPHPQHPRAAATGRRLWSGSVVRQGECECVVTATGLHTMIGEAARSIQEASGARQGVLEHKIVLAGRVLIVLTLGVVAAVMVVSVVVRGDDLESTLEMCLCLLIASVPIALPMVMKVTLSVGAKAMAKEGAIVTHLTALEEIASMRVLCSDKTGTLTTAAMVVYAERAAPFADFSAAQVLQYAALASNPNNKDDPIDRAVLAAYAEATGAPSADVAAETLKRQFRTDRYAGFTSTLKRTVAHVTELRSARRLVVAKGIVPKILSTGGDGGSAHGGDGVSSGASGGALQWEVKDLETTAPLVAAVDARLGVAGYKTIGVACSIDGGPMRFAGLLPITDPPRADSKATLRKIRDAGIAVKMVTGDHVNIARELARQVELGTDIRPSTALAGASHPARELASSAEARDAMVLAADGFAGVMPRDKHDIVAVLQNHGLVVGMTGDGVNDAAALAKAQIGIAVQGATDAAQAAADIVLTRAGLSPIFTAVMESRRIFRRLKAYVIYRICCTVQLVLFLSVIVFAFDDTFDALYIILVALLHDLTIVTIAYDHQDPSALPEAPTVRGLVVTAYALGVLLATSTLLFNSFGGAVLASDFDESQRYRQSALFLQITNSSALLIFSARTFGLWFGSKPSWQLAASALVAQLLVNLLVLLSADAFHPYFIQLAPSDVLCVWVYNAAWLFVIDLTKIAALQLQGDAPRNHPDFPARTCVDCGGGGAAARLRGHTTGHKHLVEMEDAEDHGLARGVGGGPPGADSSYV